MINFSKKIFLCIIIIFLCNYAIFAEDEKEVIGTVLNYKPLVDEELNIATIHRRFLERFFDEIRFDNCYLEKIDEGKYLVAEVFYIGKLKKESLERESYLARKKLREAKDFIIFLWRYNKNLEEIQPANLFSRIALSYARQK